MQSNWRQIKPTPEALPAYPNEFTDITNEKLHTVLQATWLAAQI